MDDRIQEQEKVSKALNNEKSVGLLVIEMDVGEKTHMFNWRLEK